MVHLMIKNSLKSKTKKKYAAFLFFLYFFIHQTFYSFYLGSNWDEQNVVKSSGRYIEKYMFLLRGNKPADVPYVAGEFYGEIIKLPIAHNEGNYFAKKEMLQDLEQKNLIAFKYCNIKGDFNEDSNPNGSLHNIAGILNVEKNILGMMPHPERLIDPILSGEDGSALFKSLHKFK